MQNGETPESDHPPNRPGRWFWKYTAVFSLLWWLLSEGDLKSWVVGIPTVLAAAAVSVRLAPTTAWRFRWTSLPTFFWQFLFLSVEGGVDVARRALAIQPKIDPGMIEFETTLPEGTARVFFANVISLCPGTVSANLRDDIISIHVLDMQTSTADKLRGLEEAVAKLFDSKHLNTGERGEDVG